MARVYLRNLTLLCSIACVSACDERPRPGAITSSEPAACVLPSPPVPSDGPVATVETALTLDRSAYGVKLVLSDSGWTLVTAEGLYRKEGEAPAEHLRAALNPPYAVMGEQVVHWAAEGLAATPLNSGTSKPLVAIDRMPRDVFASNEHFAWLERSKLGDSILVAGTSGNKANARTVYHTKNNIVTGTMLQDWVFFVESLSDGRWRLGAVSIRSAGTSKKREEGATLGVARSGRAPAFLFARTELYFYDGPTRSVRRVTPDLQEETTVAKGVICSPLAVTERIFCAHVAGVFSVEPADNEEGVARTHVVDAHPRGPITAIAANSRQVVWVEDLDGKQLRVRAARLP